ncbi:MAG: aminomuconate-semialdehyde/2-hydroxymuconate-6-semialdehyde dehydrogenase [Sphingobacteriales bacterium]|jgi:aminomuconate-semialdehyde/2-hydroxymuconate-6-semialdehyde dehydrogenase
MITLANYINGELVEPKSKTYLDLIEPATATVFGKIPDSAKEDVDEAVNAAKAAFNSWLTLPIETRSQYLLKIADLLEAKTAEFAEAESKDNGKPVSLATAIDIPRAVSNFRFFAKSIVGNASESHAMQDHSINYTLRKPIGVVGCISPWNLPLYLFTWKIAPALAVGNCVVAKPSELTPYTAFLLSQVCIEAGLPKGVFNIVHGLGPSVGSSIVDHPEIKAISFTGGTKTGEHIARSAAPKFKKLSLELGGKNPNIIFADCDFEKMLDTTVRSSFSNQGQICLCGSRIFVEKTIYDKFKTAFIKKVNNLIVGDPKEDSTNMGAVVSKPHFEKVLSYIDLAKEEGGTILTGGKASKVAGRCENGWFIEPTVIEGLAYDCRTNQEEIFGPVVTITPFETEEEVLMMANSTEYGLASTLWTENLSRAHRMADKIEAGIVWVNCWLHRDLRTPFGGVKNSGVGREGGEEVLRFFTEPKNVCIKFK